MLLGVQIALGITLAVLTILLFLNQRELSRSQRVHFESYLLADELRQSSDDLTRMARTYVTTGNEEFERQYWTVLDIRNGKIGRPLNYDRIYWDLVAADGRKPRPDGEHLSLHSLMIREGITSAEVEKLSLAQQYSDELVKTEKIAMNAVKGLYDDGRGNFTVKKRPDREWAIKLMNDDAYHNNKVNIMKPIDEFYVMLEERTNRDVAMYERYSTNLLYSLGALIIAIIGMFGFTFVTGQRQITIRNQAEEALRENEKRYIDLFDLAPIGYHELDIEGRITRINRTELDMLGYTREEMIGQFGWKFVADEDRSRQQVQGKLAGIIPPTKGDERAYRRKDGTTLPVLIENRILRDAANCIAGLRTTLQDITKPKQAEKALRENHLFLETLLNAIPAPVFYKDTEGRYIGFNTSFEMFVGKKSQEVAGKTVFEMAPRELADIYHSKDMELFQHPGVQVYETQLQDSRGIVHEVVYHKATYEDSSGHVRGLIGVILDITERKRAEAAKIESEKKYRDVVENANEIIYTTDLRGNFTYVNPAGVKTVGYTLDEMQRLNYLDLALPEHRTQLKRLYLRQYLEKTPITYVEFPTRTKSGNVLWFGQNGTLLIEHGTVLGFQLIVRDITERKRAEEALGEAAKERDKLIQDLQSALDNVKTLQGLIPICSNCKKIRDDKGFWNQVEGYIMKHSDATFTHGLCPECGEELYGDLYRIAMKKP